MPFFGICFGMQMACIEFARHVCGLDKRELDRDRPATPHPVVDLMPDQRGVTDKGATMRLGAYPCVLKAGTKAAEAYGSTEISERHRHRWEINNNYRDALERHGMVLSGPVARRAAGRDDRAARSTRTSWRASSTPSSRAGPAAPHPLFSRFIRAAVESHRPARQRGARRSSRSPAKSASCQPALGEGLG